MLVPALQHVEMHPTDNSAVGHIEVDHMVWDNGYHTTAAIRPFQLQIGSFVLFLSDILSLTVAVALAGTVGGIVNSLLLGTAYRAFETPGLTNQLIIFACMILGLCLWFVRAGHYTERRPFNSDLSDIANAVFLCLLVNGFIEFAGQTSFSRLWIVIAWLLSGMLLPLSRIASRYALKRYGMWMVPTLVIGSGAHLESIIAGLSNNGYLGYKITRGQSLAYFAGLTSRFPNARLKHLLKTSQAQTILLAPADSEIQYLPTIIDTLNVMLRSYKIVLPISNLPLAGVKTHGFLSCGAALMAVEVGLASRLNQVTKRAFDVVVSFLLLAILSPLFLLVALAVAADGGPILFRHERIGQHGKPFGCLKFRTMAPNANAVLVDLLKRNSELRLEWTRTHKLRDDPRQTRIGRILRPISIDELPQLINVLRGDMSLVGPRPVVQKELDEYYNDDQAYYVLVRPGITGLWQISGRSHTSYERRVFMDTGYVRNWSFWGDIMILIRTPIAVISRRGAY